MLEPQFKIAPEVLQFWSEITADRSAEHFAYGPVQHMGPDDFATLSKLFGAPMPQEFVAFHQTYGSVWWPDTGVAGPDHGLPAAFTLQRSGARGHAMSRVDVMLGMRALLALAAAHVAPPFATAQNPGRKRQLPPQMVPVAATAPGELILMALDRRQPAPLWFWAPRSGHPWGEGDNTDIAWVADSLDQFLAGLRVFPDPKKV